MVSYSEKVPVVEWYWQEPVIRTEWYPAGSGSLDTKHPGQVIFKWIILLEHLAVTLKVGQAHKLRNK